jgi:hypothetical protein
MNPRTNYNVDCHDIAEILLKVVLNITSLPPSTKCAALWRKSKDWLARDQDNVSIGVIFLSRLVSVS